MTERYESKNLLDAEGERVGTIEREWIDDTGQPYFVQVAIGRIFSKQRLVPLRGARHDGTDLQVPYPKQVIEDSPDVSDASDMMEGVPLAEIVLYYRQYDAERSAPNETSSIDETTERPASAAAPSDDDAPTPSAGDRRIGEVRDLGDVIEIPILEEQVEVIRRPVVKEILRIHKRTNVQQQLVQAETRREEVEIVGGEEFVESHDPTPDEQ